MSTRENVRLIARCSFCNTGECHPKASTRVLLFIDKSAYVQVHEILMQKLPFNADAKIPDGATCLIVDLKLYIYPYFVYASSEGSGESVHLHSLARAFVARQNLTCWL